MLLNSNAHPQRTYGANVARGANRWCSLCGHKSCCLHLQQTNVGQELHKMEQTLERSSSRLRGAVAAKTGHELLVKFTL